MPEICRFYGIIIRMYYNDHSPPHFHAIYGEYDARFDIQTLSMFGGELPPRARGLVVEWATQHQEELMQNWKNARTSHPLSKIEPLP